MFRAHAQLCCLVVLVMMFFVHVFCRVWMQYPCAMLLRIIFFLLLVMNAGLLVSLWLQEPKPIAERLPEVEASLPALQLIGEEDAPLASSQTPATALAPATMPDAALDNADKTEACWRYGPFLDESEAQNAFQWLASTGNTLQVRQETKLVDRGYWVYVPAMPSRADALAKSREMVEAGLSDLFVVSSGSFENGISLGLFSSEINAKRRMEQVKTVGFEAEMTKRQDSATHYHVDMQGLSSTLEAPMLPHHFDVRQARNIRCGASKKKSGV